jgi:molecular chaperone DnaJ
VTTKRDYYEVLGVPRDADGETIKKAYRKLAMQYHPDRSKEEQRAEYEALFKECSEAYEVLSDETKRQRYDSFKHGGFPGGFAPNMADIFGMPRWNVGNMPRQGDHLQASVTVELREILTECRKNVRIKTENQCSGLQRRRTQVGHV